MILWAILSLMTLIRLTANMIRYILDPSWFIPTLLIDLQWNINHQINLKLAKLLSAKEKLGQNYEYEAIFRMQYLTTIRIFAGFIIFGLAKSFPGLMFRCTSHSLRKETYNFDVILPHKHEVLPHLTSQRSVSRHIWPPFSSPCSVSSGVVQQRKMYDLITDHSQPLTGPQFNNTNYSLFGIQDQTPDHLQNYNTVLHPIKVSRYPIYWSHVLVGTLNWGTFLIIFKKSLLPVAVPTHISPKKFAFWHGKLKLPSLSITILY